MKIHPEATIHKTAIIGDNVTIQAGTKIGPFCNIDGVTIIGENCNIFTGAVIGAVPQDLKYKGEESLVIIGNNNIIREYVTINSGTSAASGRTVIGDNNLIMAYSHIAHDCLIGDGVIIANAGTLAGHVRIEDKAIVGGLSAVHQFVRIGTLSIIGGCSKVVQDIPPYATCDGHPAKFYGLNIEGLKRAKVPPQTRAVLKHAFKLLLGSGLTIRHALERIEKEVPHCPEIAHLIEFVRNSKRGIVRQCKTPQQQD